MGILKRAGFIAVWLFDWYQRLGWVWQQLVRLGVVGGLLATFRSAYGAIQAGTSPVLAIAMVLLAALLMVLNHDIWLA